jgi:hypothetical protein
VERITPERWKLRKTLGSSREVVNHFPSQHEAILSVLADQRVTGVVYGMPYHRDGSFTPGCRQAESDAQMLQAAAG